MSLSVGDVPSYWIFHKCSVFILPLAAGDSQNRVVSSHIGDYIAIATWRNWTSALLARASVLQKCKGKVYVSIVSAETQLLSVCRAQESCVVHLMMKTLSITSEWQQKTLVYCKKELSRGWFIGFWGLQQEKAGRVCAVCEVRAKSVSCSYLTLLECQTAYLLSCKISEKTIYGMWTKFGLKRTVGQTKTAVM